MLNKSTVFPIIGILISLKVIAIISITLLFMFAVPIRIPSLDELDDTEKSLYMAAEELGVNQLPAGQSPGVCDCPPVPSA